VGVLSIKATHRYIWVPSLDLVPSHRISFVVVSIVMIMFLISSFAYVANLLEFYHLSQLLYSLSDSPYIPQF